MQSSGKTTFTWFQGVVTRSLTGNAARLKTFTLFLKKTMTTATTNQPLVNRL